MRRQRPTQPQRKRPTRRTGRMGGLHEICIGFMPRVRSSKERTVDGQPIRMRIAIATAWERLMTFNFE